MSQLGQKGYLLATASGVAAAAAAATAAQAAPPVPYTWTGFYVGLNAGANWQTWHGSANYTYEGTNYPFYNASDTSVGFIGGGQIGYNWQSGNYVFGVEADISGLTGGSSVDISSGKSASSSIKWLSTVRGRVGTLIDPQDLIYVTGGVAFAEVKTSYHPPAFYGNFAKSQTSTRTGWTAGLGAEHMLSDPHWTVGVEFLYVDFGNHSFTPTNTGYYPEYTKTSHFSNNVAIARLKLNYKW